MREHNDGPGRGPGLVPARAAFPDQPACLSGAPHSARHAVHRRAQRSAGRESAIEPRRCGGFTLFEVMVALAIVAITGLAAVQSFAVATRIAERSRVELALLLSAQELVEESRLETLRPGTSRGDLRQGPFALTWERSVSSTDLPPLQRVRVRVQTADGNAPPRTGDLRVRAMKARGFTLVEALVALAVLALLAALLIGLVSRLQRDARDLERVARQTAELRTLFRAVGRDVYALVLHPSSGVPVQGQPAYYGDQDVDTLTLLCAVDHRMVGGYPLQRVSYRPVREKDDTLSVMRIAVDQGSSDTPPPQSRLVTSLKGFRVEYLTAQGQWVRVWPQGGGVGGGLPRAPRLELEEQTGAAWHTTYSLPVGGPG